VINNMDQVPSLMRNVSDDKNHWIAFKLIGSGKSPHDAVGTSAYVTAGGMRQRNDDLSGGSYESSNDQRPHFGLGQTARVDDVEIHWTDGKVEHIKVPSVDRFFAVEEGKGIVPSVYDAIAKQAQAAARKTTYSKEKQ